MSLLFLIKISAQVIMVACIIVYFNIYVRGIKHGNVKPVLATWLFLSLATLLSILTTFRENGIDGVFANLFNIVDTLAVIVIFFIVVFRKDTKRSFTVFEKCCIGVVILIFVGWFISGQNVFAHLSIQLILVVAYLPTLVHLWKAKKNTESLGMWSFDFTASVFGLVVPVFDHAFLPLVYGIRSVISTLAVIILILRLKYRGSDSDILRLCKSR